MAQLSLKTVLNDWIGEKSKRDLTRRLRPAWVFTHIWRRHNYRWRAVFDLHPALMAIEQWGFFCTQHLLWYGASVFNGHLRGSVTLTPIAERSAVELSLPFLRLRSVTAGIRRPYLPQAGQKINCATAPSDKDLTIKSIQVTDNSNSCITLSIYKTNQEIEQLCVIWDSLENTHVHWGNIFAAITTALSLFYREILSRDLWQYHVLAQNQGWNHFGTGLSKLHQQLRHQRYLCIITPTALSNAKPITRSYIENVR